ncbi:O-antigen polymerase [Halanaerobium praevalens]|uniref:O-antigen polymerase n=1 Tax=Halanaerobium praevalens (strain ATCC 33744 / DSM 2228 / GSL) TaxID=572479 RepID=E3DNF4_HALPG|nr:O-antigen polymerase [Halanaerobium praevalens]ADO76492.1 hypothetical protein Hprae_0336 [Halanaerobium praevalens DSM 2228]
MTTKKKSINLKYNNLKLGEIYPSDIIITLIFCLIFISQYMGVGKVYYQLSLIILVFFLYFFNNKMINFIFKKNNFFLFFLIFSIPIVVLITIIDKRLGPLFFLINFLSSIILAIFLYIKTERSIKLSKRIFLFLVIWFIFEGLQHGFSPKNINHYFLNSSRNSVSMIFIFSCIFLYLSYLNGNKNISLLPSIVLLIIAFMSYGRSGIILSAVIFISIWVYINFDNLSSLKLTLFFICSILMLFLLINLGSYIFTNTRLSAGLESPRFLINEAYFNEIDIVNLIVGFDYRKISIISQYNNNPHNSFILLHYNIGLGSIFLLVVILIYFIKGLINYSLKNILIIIFCLVFLLRVFFDTIAFIGIYDFLFFYSLLSINRQLV